MILIELRPPTPLTGIVSFKLYLDLEISTNAILLGFWPFYGYWLMIKLFDGGYAAVID